MASLFSVSDVIELCTLAHRAYNAWHHAGSKYAEIAYSLDSFSTSLNRIRRYAEENRSLLDKEELNDILQSSHGTISELEAIAVQHSDMRTWKRIGFSMKDLKLLRASLAEHQTNIMFYLQTDLFGSAGRIESQNVDTHVTLLEIKTQLRGLQRSGTVMSKHTSSNPSAWKTLEREMIEAGLPSDAIERYTPQIKRQVLRLAAEEQKRLTLNEEEEDTEDSSSDSEAESESNARRCSWQSDGAAVQYETGGYIEETYVESHNIMEITGHRNAWQSSVRNETRGVAGQSREVRETVHETLDLCILKGPEVQSDGYVVDAEGIQIGQLTEGDAEDLMGYLIGDDGEILDEDGDVVGRVELLQDEIDMQSAETSTLKRQVNKQSASFRNDDVLHRIAKAGTYPNALRDEEGDQVVDRHSDAIHQARLVCSANGRRISGLQPASPYYDDQMEEEYSAESEHDPEDAYGDDQLSDHAVQQETYATTKGQNSRKFWNRSWRKKGERALTTGVHIAAMSGLVSPETEDDLEQA